MKNLTFEFAHVGVNGETKEEAFRFLKFCQDVLHFDDAREVKPSYFIADEKMELMKEGGEGTHGHIGFFTNDLMGALHYLEELGYEADWEHARLQPDGKTIRMVYLKDEFNGFKIHFAEKKY